MNGKARNKTALAARLGYTRTTLYTFMRLPGFPVPDRRGQWNISACRKFILKQAKRVHGPAERDRMQAELLNLKIQRASQELADFEQRLSEEISKRFSNVAERAFAILATALNPLPQEVAPILVGMPPGEISKELKRRLDKARIQAVEEFRGYAGKNEPDEKIIEFQAKIAATA
jgi:hypothetical protein